MATHEHLQYTEMLSNNSSSAPRISVHRDASIGEGIWEGGWEPNRISSWIESQRLPLILPLKPTRMSEINGFAQEHDRLLVLWLHRPGPSAPPLSLPVDAFREACRAEPKLIRIFQFGLLDVTDFGSWMSKYGLSEHELPQLLVLEQNHDLFYTNSTASLILQTQSSSSRPSPGTVVADFLMATTEGTDVRFASYWAFAMQTHVLITCVVVAATGFAIFIRTSVM